MAWKRGRGTLQVELANVQSQVEYWSCELDGTGGGDEGMIQEWHDDKAQRAALRSFVKIAVALGGLLVGVPASALTIIEIVKMVKGH